MKIYDVSCHQLFIMFASSLDNKARRAVCFFYHSIFTYCYPSIITYETQQQREREEEMQSNYGKWNEDYNATEPRAVSNPIVAFFFCRVKGIEEDSFFYWLAKLWFLWHVTCCLYASFLLANRSLFEIA